MEPNRDLIRDICEERFATINRRLAEGEGRMDKMERDIASIDKVSAILDARLINVVEGLESNNAVLKWIIGGIVTQLIAFFFYAIRTGIFG